MVGSTYRWLGEHVAADVDHLRVYKMLFMSLGCMAGCGWGRTFCAGEGYIITIVSMTLPSRRRGGAHIPINKLVWTVG